MPVFGNSLYRCRFLADRNVKQYDRLLVIILSSVHLFVCLSVRLWHCALWSSGSVKRLKVVHRVPMTALPIHFYRHFCRIVQPQHTAKNLTAEISASVISMGYFVVTVARCQADLSSFPFENWRRPPGHPRTTWMKTTQQDLESLSLSLNEAIDVAQNRPLWRMMSTFRVTHS